MSINNIEVDFLLISGGRETTRQTSSDQVKNKIKTLEKTCQSILTKIKNNKAILQSKLNNIKYEKIYKCVN